MNARTPVDPTGADIMLGPSAGPRPGTLSPTLAGRSVLIWENDGITLLQVARALSRAGATIVGAAATGGEALSLARARPPDIVVADPDPPDEDGLQVIAQLARAHPPICVVVVTLVNDPDTRTRVAETGAACLMIKPLASDCLVAQVEEAYQAWTAAARTA